MSLKDLLLSSSIRLILFGGKGGVGKTSCSAASAIWAADHGKKTLIISTDPAHSLADSLGQKLVLGEVTKIEAVDNLWALEIKPKMDPEEMSKVMAKAGPELGPLVSNTGSLTPPGMDEAMAFGKVLEFLHNTEYDLVIFDTAPTGHTLRLLGIPDMLSSWTGKMIMMRLKFGKLLSNFKSLFATEDNQDIDVVDELKRLKKTIEESKKDLMDPEKTSFVIVMISELMAIYETERLLNILMDYQIPVKNMIVNQIVPETTKCEFCQHRRTMQFKHLKEIRHLYGDDYILTEVEQYHNEIRKPESLRKLASILTGEVSKFD